MFFLIIFPHIRFGSFAQHKQKQTESVKTFPPHKDNKNKEAITHAIFLTTESGKHTRWNNKHQQRKKEEWPKELSPNGLLCGPHRAKVHGRMDVLHFSFFFFLFTFRFSAYFPQWKQNNTNERKQGTHLRSRSSCLGCGHGHTHIFLAQRTSTCLFVGFWSWTTRIDMDMGHAPIFYYMRCIASDMSISRTGVYLNTELHWIA